MNKARQSPLHLFAGTGIELEYMLVDRNTLDVLPKADELLKEVTGSYSSDFEKDGISWTNELALHVIELKTTTPVSSLAGTVDLFQQDILMINDLLSHYNGRLMPTGAHPWMNPAQARLWPHGDRIIYETYNRIFNCSGHGWVNLQSSHVNLPFHDAAEFSRLHAAIRLLLPIIPALAASSPLLNGDKQELLDSRLEFYRTNSKRIPSITGDIIPESVFSPTEYQEKILNRMYADIQPHDQQGVLRHEWLNARGAIARFDRNTIEIRIIDIQECPAADLAVAEAIGKTLRAMVDGIWLDHDRQKCWETPPLVKILGQTVQEAEQAVISDSSYLAAFGIYSEKRVMAGELWNHIIENLPGPYGCSSNFAGPLGVILRKGTLATRILKAAGDDFSKTNLMALYDQLCNCLQEGILFEP